MTRDEMLVAPARSNMWSTDDQNVGFVRIALTSALEALNGLDDDAHDVPADRIDDIAKARRLINNLDRHLPNVMAWCVVKHYGNRDWSPIPWVGLKTRDQAIAFRDVIAKHYDAQARAHGWDPDRWVVEFRSCPIVSMYAPHVSAADYASAVLVG